MMTLDWPRFKWFCSRMAKTAATADPHQKPPAPHRITKDRDGVTRIQISVRVPEDLWERVLAYRLKARKRYGFAVSARQVVEHIIEKGLEAEEANRE